MCGPTNLKIAMEPLGVKMPVKTLAKMCGATADGGVAGERLLATAKKLGLNGFIKDRATIEELRRFLQRGMRVIVSWFSIDEGHYSVVLGLGRKYITLTDTEYGKKRKMKIEVFQRVWFDFPGEYIRNPKNLALRSCLVLHR